MIEAREELLDALAAAIAVVDPARTLAQQVAAFESPRQATHGDLACTAAMPLARAQRRNPREVAAELIAALRAQPAVERWVESIEVAGPGFINLHLKALARQRIVAEVLAAGERFGRVPTDPARRVLVEFVSANPTGPLHVGHTRQAALGDALCNLLEARGAAVTREFYYNDAGVQIETLARSVAARLDGLAPGDAGWPEAAYNGDYVADIARGFAAGETVRADDRTFTASGRRDDAEGIRDFAVAWLRHEQDLDLQALGVRFDRYALESALYTEGRVARAVERLVGAGKTFEEGGALWLRTTEYGDDKDRVMRKSDGTFTYFVPDVAYHLGKWERGFERAIDIQGSDHHGTVARVRAGLQAAGMGVPPTFPEYVLHTMVRVERGGVEVKVSKRAGSYVTLRDLVEWTSADAVRFFMLSRKADTEFAFDLDLAVKQSDENPVFYVQYAHARICSVLDQPQARAMAAAGDPKQADLARLVAPSEAALMKKLADYPQVVALAAAALAPHDIAFYLRDLAAAFHTFYAAERVLLDDAELARARLALLAATRQVLRNALALLGVAAPERLARDTPKTLHDAQPHFVLPRRARGGFASRRVRGGFTIGLVVGLLIGLSLALGVALYVTKAPNPFVNKVPPRPAGSDQAEAEKNRAWDPNASLAGRAPMPAQTAPALPTSVPQLVPPTVTDPLVGLPASAASAPARRASSPREVAVERALAQAQAEGRDPVAALAAPPSGSDPFVYFVQAGAFARSEDAEQQRAKLAMAGVESRLFERDQAGRTVWRVRVGPFSRKEEADMAKEKLGDAGVDAALVRVQR